jgi:tRNA threonylcarbamoyladenosine biosynthesis protein TsaB
MILHIDTTTPDEIIISLEKDNKFLAIKKIKAPRTQAEKLLPAIDKLLKSQKIKISRLQKIIVANFGGSFTSLRIGVITANALAYALNIPVEAAEKNQKNIKKFSGYSIVEPRYDREPNIGISKKPKL